ncbi:hypothetical protein [Phaffia rhodozyma]|uniref:NADH-ubiquinone oxidoreductase B15 subunit n=1 Tax=Phaffia rhodozyma TaxID=264483 RepID=A0A0F7SLN8_PHARH|nr:hypothetical protein [Phaffia rhodozyma]
MIPTRVFRASDHGYQPVLKDPAVERWSAMREDLYKGFRISRRNILPILGFAVAFPLGVYYVAVWETNQGFDLAGATYEVPLRRVDRRLEDLDELRSLQVIKQYKDL